MRETARMRTSTEFGPGAGMGISARTRFEVKVGERWDLEGSL